MDEPRFDQHDQEVHSQQNAGHDIINVYVFKELSEVQANLPQDKFLEILQTVKVALKPDGRKPPVVPPLPGEASPAPPPMQPFQPQQADPFHGGAGWLPQLQNLAQQQGDAWVPRQTQGLQGVDLTGIWTPPMAPFEQDYIRQYGPYLNFISGIGSVPFCFAEGVVNPENWFVRLVGRYQTGAPVEVHARLFPDWSLQGTIYSVGMFNFPTAAPLFLRKIA